MGTSKNPLGGKSTVIFRVLHRKERGDGLIFLLFPIDKAFKMM